MQTTSTGSAGRHFTAAVEGELAPKPRHHYRSRSTDGGNHGERFLL